MDLVDPVLDAGFARSSSGGSGSKSRADLVRGRLMLKRYGTSTGRPGIPDGSRLCSRIHQIAI